MQKLLLFFLIPIIGFSQINDEKGSREIFIKLKNNSTKSNSKRVEINSELGFLSTTFKSNSSKMKIEKPFYATKSKELKSIYRLKIDEGVDIKSFLENLKSNLEIEYVEIVPLRFCTGISNDVEVGNQWSLPKIKAFDAWDINPGNQIIKIAIVDNAIQTNHVDLLANMLPGFDIADNDSDTNPPNEQFGHGTHVAGIAGAVTNNTIGIASPGNNKIKIIPVKVTPDLGNPNGIYNGYEGIIWAADNGANIISCSWGGSGYSATEKLVIDYAVSKGCIVVAAAGNDNTDLEYYPAAYPNVISVASTDSNDKKSSFSTYGTWVDISAPGRGILSSIPFNTYGSYNGTSMSTPLLSACLGFVWSYNPTLSALQVENIIKSTADNIESDNPNYQGKLGSGRVNLLKAIACPDGGINSASITANGSTYFCEGENVVLTANGNNSSQYTWLKNSVRLNENTSNITVTSEGSYKVIITNNNCSILSDETLIRINKVKSNSPLITNSTLPYCSYISENNGLKATAINCNLNGPTTFEYFGGTVGYDAFEKSGENPKILVDNIAGLIQDVSISITWQKKDQGNEFSCGNPDLGRFPYNEEISFKLKSPDGKIITILSQDTYAAGTTSSGLITTVFKNGEPNVLNGSLPTSGNYSPLHSFSILNNDVPVGIWELIPEDNGFGDPLCVSGFSITIKTNSSSNPPEITWWNSKENGTLLKAGDAFAPSNTTVGKHTYFVQSKCDGACPSERPPAIFTIKAIPELITTRVPTVYNQVLLNKINNQAIINEISNLSTNQIVVSPYTMCDNNTNYFINAIGCKNNDVKWFDNQLGTLYTINPQNQTLVYAMCNEYQKNDCPQINSENFHFVQSNTNNFEISQTIIANTNQNFVQEKLIAKNIIETPSTIEYRGTKSIELKPGFEVKANSIFKAEIKGCD